MSIRNKLAFTALILVAANCSSSGTTGGKGTGGSSGNGGSGGVPSSTGGSGGSHPTGGAPGTGGSGTGGSSTGGAGGTPTGGNPGTGGSSTGDASAPDSGGAKDGPTGHDGSGGTPDTSGGGAAGNTIMGTAGGKPFTSIVSALWLGKPDPNNGSPAEVVELFDVAVKCSQITVAGWDAMLGSGLGMEIKVGGNAPGMFHAVGNPATVAPGEAAVATTALSANPVEDASVSGPVTITAINPGKNITGTFDIKLMSGMVTGSFDATYCAAGREP